MPKQSRTLWLAVKQKYFDQIKRGEKKEEYRAYKPYWIKRLVDREYDWLVISSGYPRKEETDKFLTYEYNGYYLKEITHEEFGENPEKVFAIYLEKE